MGIILDSSVIIAAERRGHTVRQILEQLQKVYGEAAIGISVVTIAELMHGAYRTRTETSRKRRVAFVDRLCSDVPVHPLTVGIARSVGQIEGEQAARGTAIAFEDLAIEATALQLGFDIATLNVRHFKLIPGLNVRSLPDENASKQSRL